MTFSSTIQSANSTNGSLCSHRLLSNGVHEFNFQESSRAAVNEWIDHLIHLLDASLPETILTLVVDTRQSGTLPLGYVIGKLRNIYREYEQRPLMRLAFLSETNALMVFVQMLAEIAAGSEVSTVQYHQSPTKADAIEWLLAAQ